MYTEKKLVGIAKRENNNKRKYLVVNKMQGKHVPVSPKCALDMFDTLADKVKSAYGNENLLLVGFAETATAIGAALAVNIDSFYIQTTREKIDNVEYMFFSESHSHATEQKLIKTDIDGIVKKIDRIVFVEDEVTTGNTILNIINIIKKEYGDSIKFSVACILNGMNEEATQKYEDLCIDIHYLVKTNHDTYTEIAEGFQGDGEYVLPDNTSSEVCEISVSEYVNARRLTKGKDYKSACEKMWQQLSGKINLSEADRVLVVGSEEFMYPALFVSKKIEEKLSYVRCHSTTRSPIVVGTEENYPLHTRYELASLYEKERRTFIYDLDKYDKVIIITDACNDETEGVNTLLNAIKSNGNDDICLVRWC